MTKLGFSLYPEHSSLENTKNYMQMMKRHGAKRLFMSLLQLDSEDTKHFDKYKEIIAYARQLDIKVIADISPRFIASAGWEDQVILKAYEFGLSGIRLDEALPIEDIVSLTHNPHGIKIELNMSTDDKLLVRLLEQDCQKEHLIACHNFYPHEFTGLSVKHFLKMSSLYHDNGIETAAFVSAQTASEGPWPLSEGLPTLEDHRHLPLLDQVKFMKAIGTIDNVLISNQFMTEEELAPCATVLNTKDLTLTVHPIEHLTAIERKIISHEHVYRGDISDYLIRSTMPRLVYREERVLPRDEQSKQVTRGSVIIDNDRYTRYKGELQIALKPFTLTGKSNIVGQIADNELDLLDYLKPWQSFKLALKS